MQANLAERMSGRPMDLRAIRTTVAHSLRALKYLHERGIIHGDLKPSNMMLDARRRIKLGDFGLARRVSNEEGSLLKGTTKYMAPETVSEEFGEVGPASDLYSLGFAAYELMCGSNFESLFPGLSAFGRNQQVAWMMWHAAMDRRLPDIHRVLEGVPDDLALVIQRLCEKDQAKRYQLTDEALSDLNVDVKLVKTDLSTTMFPQTEHAAPTDRKRLWLAGGAFAASLVLSLVMLFMPAGSGSADPEEMNVSIGVVREVNPEQESIVIKDTETGIPEELKLGRRPRIYLRNTKENILLRELRLGDRVTVERTFGDDGRPEIRLNVSRPVSSIGSLQSLDLRASRLVISVERASVRENLSLRIPERAVVTLNGVRVELSALEPGDRVEVAHLDEVGGQGGRVADSLSAMRSVEAVGFVAAVSPDGSDLTVGYGKGSASASLTLPIANDCKITLQGESASSGTDLKPAELRKDDRVRFRRDAQFREIFVTRSKERASGVVREIQPQSRQLVLRTDEGTELVLEVDESCDVVLGLERAVLTALRQFDQVDVTYDSQDGRSLARTIDVSRPVKHDRWAIVIAGRSFNDTFLSPLPYALADAFLIKESLRNRYACAEDRVLMLMDKTRDDLERDIAPVLQDAGRQTQVVVYVGTHAYVGDDNRVYLAGKDFNWDRAAETGLSLNWLVERLEACAAGNKLLLFDASHQGNGRDLEQQPAASEMLKLLAAPLKSTVAIASCDAGQRGYELPAQRHGLFAYFLAEGFAGPADSNRDLWITPAEMYAYLQQQMSQAELSGGKSQTPVLFGPSN